jgi:type II secretory pathway pseudopilin PulG
MAGLLIILTILAVFIAYTVPRMWSDVLRRERDRETIFAMKQYARAIARYQSQAKVIPASLDQLKAVRPRVIRGRTGEIPDPLTGEVDWVPLTSQTGTPLPGTAGSAPGAPSTTGTSGTSGTGTPSSTLTDHGNEPSPDTRIHRLGTSLKNFSGPFIGVRPGVTGQSFIELNGTDRYESWSYTTVDLQNEVNAAVSGTATPGTTTTAPSK